jgi:hypothetical protein
VDPPIDTAAWQLFEHPEFRLRFRYPAVTPEGRTVERTESRHGSDLRVHLTTHDRAEVYIEVSLFRGLAPVDEYARHQPYLEQRFGKGATSPLTETSLLGQPTWTYDFHWDQGRRAVYLFQVGNDTYRILHNPNFPLNREMMSTLAITE